MTALAFHFNAPDKQAYVCRLLRKAVGAGARAVVTAPASELARLDVLLWTFSQLDFIAHVRLNASVQAQELALSAVVLAEDSDAKVLPQRQVLVNLGPDVPAAFASYERVIEVVGLDEADRQQARQRWLHYTGLGYSIERHDLKLKA